MKDPFKVVLKTSKLPLSLLDSKPVAGKEKFHILDTEPYSETFSKVKFESIHKVLILIRVERENDRMLVRKAWKSW